MKINNDTNALKPKGRKQTHKDLLDIGTLTHAQLEAQLREIIPQNYASISNGVTNGDAHDHNGGDGAQIDYNTLANQPTIINPPATTAANDVQVGDGAGAWITNTIAQFITTLRATLDSVYAAVAHSHAWGTITGTLASQTDLQTALDGKVDENAAITGATKTKITYDAKGLVTAGADATTADIADSTNKRYVTDADLIDIGNLSGTNTGDQDLSGLVPYTVLTDTKDPTGWLDPSNVTVSYDSTARTITLTPVSGTLQYYWRGVKYDLGATWTSSAHTATNGTWFLSSTDGTTFTWSTTVWTFDVLMVAFVNYGATYKFGLREVHGLMQWDVHEELHRTIGTYKESGGTLSGYTLLSTTAANRRPNVAATILHDEDNETTNAALTSKLYNKLYLAGSTPTITYTGETADIVPLLGNNPYYNAYAAPNWQQTLMSNNSYMSVWLVAIPTTADTTSQTYRYTWIQGQSNTNLAGQTALTPSDLNMASFTSESTEFVFLAKVIIRYTGGNWDLYSVTVLTGNRMIQVGSPAGAYLSSVATDATLTGDGSLASPLAVVQSYGLTSGTLAQFAATTSAQLAGVLSDETGTGAAVFANAPTFSAAPTIAPATPTNGTDLLKFTIERAWTLQQASTGGTSMLEFFSDTAGKYVRINPNDLAAGGLVIGGSFPATPERLHVIGTGNIKIATETLSSTGYAFNRLKSDGTPTMDFGQYGTARTGTTFGISNAGLGVVAQFGAIMVFGTFNAYDLHIGTSNVPRISVLSTGPVTIHQPVNYAADAQASDTYVITLAPALLAYSTGLEINFKANTANTGAATINVNGLGAKTIVKGVSTTLANNDILAGMFCKIIYDGTNFVLFNPRTL